VQYEEYLTYSAGYAYRVCADISFVALREARKKLGEKGLYLLCDITNLPLRDGAMDGFVSLHTIYHIPAAQQSLAIAELARTLRPGGSGAVVYGWGDHAPLMRMLLLPYQLVKRLLRKGDPPAEASSEAFYFYNHDYAWFRREVLPLADVRLAVWRSVNVPFLKRLVRERLLGHQGLRLLYRLEEWFPRFFGRNGAYPLFAISKKG
jgi:SAM-dependent methyltransferase